MWREEPKPGVFKYREYYTHPYTLKQKKASVTLNSDSPRAQNEARRLLTKKIDKLIKDIKIGENKNLTFNDVAAEWLNKYKHTVKAKTATTREYSLNLLNKIIPEDYLISKIDNIYIQEQLEKLYYEEDYSFNYVKQVKTTASIIFDFAVSKKYIDKNIIEDVTLKKKPATLEEIENVENNYLEHDELYSIIKRQRSTHNGKRNADLTEFLALTGIRIGEAISLKEEHFFNNYVLVKGTLDYISNKYSDAVVTTTKTINSTRKVELSKRTSEIVNKLIKENKLLAERESYNDRGFIFTSIHGNPISVGSYNDSLAVACKHLKINKRVTSHVMRHTHVSLLAELNIPLKAIMKRVGHSDAETTIKIYMHVTEKMNDNLIDKLESIDLTAPFSPPNQKKSVDKTS